MKLLFSFVLCAASVAYGQSDSTSYRKNAFKINIVPPILSATSEFSYELFLNQRLSVVAGIGANLKGNQSDFVLYSDADLSFLNREITNRYFLAQVRRYIDFNNCNKIPSQGFYAGGFIRYQTVNLASDLKFGNRSTNLNTRIEMDYKALNFGALVGYQVNLNNWLIDFEFGGLGYSPRWVQFNASSSLSNAELERLSNTLSQNFGIGGNYKDIELNSTSAETSFWYWNFRYAVSIGYNF